jgi:hypothetical protein
MVDAPGNVKINVSLTGQSRLNLEIPFDQFCCKTSEENILSSMVIGF